MKLIEYHCWLGQWLKVSVISSLYYAWDVYIFNVFWVGKLIIFLWMVLQYYLKTGTCKFGATCKFHHPRDKAGIAGRVSLNILGYPLRPVRFFSPSSFMLLDWFECTNILGFFTSLSLALSKLNMLWTVSYLFSFYFLFLVISLLKNMLARCYLACTH